MGDQEEHGQKSAPNKGKIYCKMYWVQTADPALRTKHL